jgi:hypothetical protein
MVRGPHYYPSKGACIYCNATGVPLSDEHIVPLSLGGTHVIRNASCATCRDITSNFEGNVARGLWGDARTAFDQPTRHKVRRAKEIPLPTTGLPIPISDYPGGFVFYKMGQCGFLRGSPETVDISGTWQLVVIDDDARRENFTKKYGVAAALEFRHVPDDFGRLLAKIAYCQVLTALNPGEFEPLALPYILGTKRNLSYIVGSSDGAPESDNGYRLTTAYADAGDHLILLVEIRLYANTHAPTYHVITGYVTGAANIECAKAALSAAQ